MKVLTKAKELEKHTYTKTRSEKHFPKKDRVTLVNRLQQAASDIVDYLDEVNDHSLNEEPGRTERFQTHRNALRACRRLLRLIELTHTIGIIGEDEFAYWGSMAADVKNMSAAWYKADMNRKPKG